MKIVSFNANSIRARLHQLEAIIDSHHPDIIGIQETKVTDEEFPVAAIENLQYHAIYHGQKSHYGVALLSKTKPIKVQLGYTHDNDLAQRRFISAKYETSIGELTVINGYFPQGESRSNTKKYTAKQTFYADLLDHLDSTHQPSEQLIVMGDMNIAPEDIDIGIGEENRKRWLSSGKCSFLPEERQWLQSLRAWGLMDSYRKHNPAADHYSWFDYRSKGFDKDPKKGLRIDLILTTDSLINRIQNTGIDYDLRAMDKPSDHCPVWVEF